VRERPVAVYGATGHTGRFVVQELERRGRATVSIGRTPGQRLAGTEREWRFASCDDPDALDEAFRGTAAVINCAGPFLDTAPAVIEAALRAGIHYLDVTAEQRAARQSLATYQDEAADRGVVVLPATAFYGGLADLLAADIVREARSIESIEVAVALDFWHPTPGTRQTGERNTARRLIVADGRLVPLPRPAPVRTWTFPEPFGQQEVAAVPLSEIIAIRRHLPARHVCSYINTAPLEDLGNPGTPAPTPSDPSGRSSQRFLMDVHAQCDGGKARAAVSGRDVYAVTAPIVVEACLRVLRDPPAKGGAYAPAELFDPAEFLAALEPHVASHPR
jgi:short subunit dehydrogenase-like uncharacterized protein